MGRASNVFEDQRAAATTREDAGQQPSVGVPTAAAGLAVPWSARQALVGAAVTLIPLIGVQVWAAVGAPAAATSAKPLTSQQDWTTAVVIVFAQLLVEGVFLLAPQYYLRKGLPGERRLDQVLQTLGFRRFAPGPAALIFVVGLATVLAFNYFYSRLGLSTNADALVQQATRAPVSTLTTLLLAVTVVPVFEEVFFRGFLFPGLARAMPVWAAVIASSLIFGAAHADLNSFAPLAVIGAVLALLRWRTGSLWPGILFHAAINAEVLIYTIGLLVHR
jgi:membrane protease YdiL (CAAX protease family)